MSGPGTNLGIKPLLNSIFSLEPTTEQGKCQAAFCGDFARFAGEPGPALPVNAEISCLGVGPGGKDGPPISHMMAKM
jgi:hypothetical protein